jgi:ABC-type transporter Mla maintaining outer membrane lipid asymmetry permease subunit MlaE
MHSLHASVGEQRVRQQIAGINMLLAREIERIVSPSIAFICLLLIVNVISAILISRF